MYKDYNDRKSGDAKFIIYLFLACALMFFIAMSLLNLQNSRARLQKTQSDLAELKKLDVCINQANTIGLDPNDTEQRSDFIKTCYEAQNE